MCKKNHGAVVNRTSFVKSEGVACFLMSSCGVETITYQFWVSCARSVRARRDGSLASSPYHLHLFLHFQCDGALQLLRACCSCCASPHEACLANSIIHAVTHWLSAADITYSDSPRFHQDVALASTFHDRRRTSSIQQPRDPTSNCSFGPVHSSEVENNRSLSRTPLRCRIAFMNTTAIPHSTRL